MRWQEAAVWNSISIMAATRSRHILAQRAPGWSHSQSSPGAALWGIMVVLPACWGASGDLRPPWGFSVFEMEGIDSQARKSSWSLAGFPEAHALRGLFTHSL